MKKTYKYKLLIGACALFLLPACNFEDINTNPYEMTDEMGKLDGIAVGGPITAMQASVFPVGTQADGTDVVNQYQNAYHLGGDTWSGYFGQNNNWYNGNNNTTYYMVDAWMNDAYQNSYTNIFSSWKEVKDKAELAGIPEAFSLAQILKISTWHKATDMFGPIPYKKAGDPILNIPYDSQEEVYKSFFTDLEAAIAILTDKAEQGAQILPNYDAIYGGSTTKWVKYANTLMLRLAMRVRYADAELSKKYALMAINHPIGIMTSKDDEAKISTGAGLVFINNIETIANQYGESRMGSSMFSYLVGYEDPRLMAYFKPSASEHAADVPFAKAKYQALPTGHTQSQNSTFESFSAPNIAKTAPTYWMRASEAYFLRAEAALIWAEAGDAASLYEQGIATSFDESGISPAEVSAYMDSNNTPTTYEVNAGWYYNFSAAAPTQATVEFSGSQEAKLEKIMIQKWIALYPNGQEAWSEWRRTGYPKLHEVNVNRGGLTEGVRRMVYPLSSYQSEEDKENIQQAIELLGGPDKASTKLWWDKK